MKALCPVGTFAPNPFGLHEVHGNVGEWCRDRSGRYDLPVRPGDGELIVPETKNRTVRGGAFNESVLSWRSARRFLGAFEYRDDFVGVRPARAIATR